MLDIWVCYVVFYEQGRMCVGCGQMKVPCAWCICVLCGMVLVVRFCIEQSGNVKKSHVNDSTQPHPRPESILSLWTQVHALPGQMLLPARETNLYLHSVSDGCGTVRACGASDIGVLGLYSQSLLEFRLGYQHTNAAIYLSA